MQTERSNIGFPPHHECLDAVFCQTCLDRAAAELEWVQKPEIMIVAEEFAFSQALGAILKDQDCQIYLAPDFHTAVEDLKNYSIDLLIIQVKRGNRVGMAAIDQAKQIPDAKVIVISGPHGEDLPVEAFELEADDYLVYPFTTAELNRRVAELLPPTLTTGPDYQEKSRAEKINERALKPLQLLMAEIRSSLLKATESLRLSAGEASTGVGLKDAAHVDEILREISHVIGLTTDFYRRTVHLAQFNDW